MFIFVLSPLFFYARRTFPYLLGTMGVLFILVFEVSSHFEVEGAVCVHNPNSCILSWLKQSWEEEEAAGWQDM